MPQFLNNTLAPNQPSEWVDPAAERRARLEALMQQQPAPMYSPEEAAQRIAQNKRDYQMGMLAQLSGDEVLAPVGGAVLKNALANRQQRVTERGVADPLTGKFTPSPEYIGEQRLAERNKLDAETERSRADYLKERRAAADKKELRGMIVSAAGARANADEGLGIGGSPAAFAAGDGGVQLFRDKHGRVYNYDDSGNPVQYRGKVGAKPSNATPSIAEQQASSWVLQAENAMKSATDAIQKSKGEAAKMGYLERAAGFVPFVGEDLANSARDPQRQRYVHAASSFSEAALRAATGAGINESEAKQKIRELTPQLNDSDELLAQKADAWKVYLASFRARAGRALPSGASGSWDSSGGGSGGGATDFNSLPK